MPMKYAVTGVALSMFAALFAAMPAFAQAMPSDLEQEVLVRTSLLTFNDANVTGNYTVLHDKLSKPFRDQFSADKLKDTFKVFADKHIDFDIVAAKPITPSSPAKIDDSGVLHLDGDVVVTPQVKVTYHFQFIRSEGEWKLFDINIKL